MYRDGKTFSDMVGEYSSAFSPPKNANVADIHLSSSNNPQYGHRVVAYK
jgi:hypothetical protein